MSTIGMKKSKCAICGVENEYRILTSTNTFGGGPDLDLRPAEMQRSTMHLWVHECPNCGYVSGDVSDPTNITADFLKTPEFLSCDDTDFKSDLAARFYKYYTINVADQNPLDAFYAILHAAWASDDKNDVDNAKQCRNLALPLVDELIKEGGDREETYSLMKADLLRRSGRFEELLAEYSSTTYSDDLLNKILAFQIEHAKEQDTKCYRVSDVTGNK